MIDSTVRGIITELITCIDCLQQNPGGYNAEMVANGRKRAIAFLQTSSADWITQHQLDEQENLNGEEDPGQDIGC